VLLTARAALRSRLARHVLGADPLDRALGGSVLHRSQERKQRRRLLRGHELQAGSILRSRPARRNDAPRPTHLAVNRQAMKRMNASARRSLGRRCASAEPCARPMAGSFPAAPSRRRAFQCTTSATSHRPASSVLEAFSRPTWMLDSNASRSGIARTPARTAAPPDRVAGVRARRRAASPTSHRCDRRRRP
jgi:hypothetical protein